MEELKEELLQRGAVSVCVGGGGVGGSDESGSVSIINVWVTGECWVYCGDVFGIRSTICKSVIWAMLCGCWCDMCACVWWVLYVCIDVRMLDVDIISMLSQCCVRTLVYH